MGKKKLLFKGNRVDNSNTFIGGIGLTINTKAQLAVLFNVNENDIQFLKISGNDVRFLIEVNYILIDGSFKNNIDITYFEDRDGFCSKLGNEIFRGTTNFTYFKSPSCIEIGGSTFYLSGLDEFVGNNVLELGFGCFRETKLTSISLPNLDGNIDAYSFRDCSLLEFINVPFMTTVHDYAFYGCTSLNSFDYFEQLTYINRDSFGLTSSLLIEVNLPLVTSQIENTSFKGSGITKINAPNVKTIGNNTFENCTNLTEAIITSVTSLGVSSFSNSKVLNFDLPSCISIAFNCFSNNTEFNSIYLPVCTALGNTTNDNQVFANIKLNATITVNIFLETVHDSPPQPDQDLVYAETQRGATIIYV